MRVRLPGINTVTKILADGTAKKYHYHRATGTPLMEAPGSPEFVKRYSDAEKKMGDRLAGKLNQLIRDYTLSTKFNSLGSKTQAEYRRLLKTVEIKFGDMPIAALNDPRVRMEFLDWQDEVARSSGPREADHRLSALSALLTWAVDRSGGRIAVNYIKGFTRLYHSSRADIIWLPEHIKSFMDVAPIELQRGLILGLHSGQREGDLLRMPWSAYDGQWLILRQRKRKRKGKRAPLLRIKCTATLRKMLDGMERISPLILTTKTGRSFKKRYFSRLWEKAMKDAGLERVTLPDIDEPVSLHFNDLRGTTVTLLAEAECTVPQIATITGHSLKTVHNILENYLSRTRGLAEQAMSNFENSSRTDFANQLQTKTPSALITKGKTNV